VHDYKKSEEIVGASEDEGPDDLHAVDETYMRGPSYKIVDVPK
jgi:hypothetical protein